MTKRERPRAWRAVSRSRRRRGRQGFSIVEMLVVMAVLMIAASMAIPGFQRMVRKQKLLGHVEQIEIMMRVARIEAIKSNDNVGVWVDTDSNTVVTFRDVDTSCTPSPGDEMLRVLPYGATDVDPIFAGPSADTPPITPDAAKKVDGFNLTTADCLGGATVSGSDPNFPVSPNGGWAIFQPNGSAFESGAFRFCDRFGNFLQIRVDPPATAKIVLQKWGRRTSSGNYEWLSGNEAEGKAWEWT